MKSFDEIQSQWNSQKRQVPAENGHELIIRKVNTIKKKQTLTNVILVITVIVLIFFFIYISAYNDLLVTFSLLLMIISLATRVALEMRSIKMLNNLNVSTTVENFKIRMINYYKKRVNTHLIWTPIIILLYSIGFILLLPAFKANLSSGFYNYIIVSALVMLLLLGMLIFTQIRKELAILRELKS
tara:strand:+ start:1612 stop:2166 length:555 start_codon:yes stop_codon:yes gene_type:complete